MKKQEQEEQIQVNVLDHYIKSLKFDNFKSDIPASDAKDVKPEVQLEVDVSVFSKGNSQHEVCLHFRSSVIAGASKLLNLDLDYAGLCILNEAAEANQDRILHIYCANMIFPFARRVIADVTRDAGFPPMLVNAINFAEIYNKAQVMQH